MDRHHDAARLLLSARRDPSQKLRSLPEVMRPTTEAEAYLIQRGVMAELGEIGGWKVGSPHPDGPVNCSPLPLSGIQTSPGHATEEPIRAVEAEIAVRLGQDLPVRSDPYAEADILAAIASAHPALEVLTGRFADPDAVDGFSGLADSGSHGGLIVGPPVPGWTGIDLAHETVRLMVNGGLVKESTGNPGGPMLRLLIWLANTGAHWAGGLRAGQVVTTGSWTGKDVVPPMALVRAEFGRCGAVEVRFGPNLAAPPVTP